MFQQERDRVMMALKQKQMETTAVQTEVGEQITPAHHPLLLDWTYPFTCVSVSFHSFSMCGIKNSVSTWSWRGCVITSWRLRTRTRGKRSQRRTGRRSYAGGWHSWTRNWPRPRAPWRMPGRLEKRTSGMSVSRFSPCTRFSCHIRLYSWLKSFLHLSPANRPACRWSLCRSS